MLNNATQIFEAFLESQLQNLALTDPNASVEFYISGLYLEDSRLAEVAAVAIKKYHLTHSEKFEKIDLEKLKVLARGIFAILNKETCSLSLSKRLMEILALLYANDNGTFEDLIKEVFSLHQAPSIRIKISVIYFVDLLCTQCFDEDFLKEISDDLSKIFQKFLGENDKSLLIATVKAIGSFLSTFEDKKFAKKFAPFIPFILKILVEAVREDEESAISIIQSLGDIVEDHSNLLKEVLEDILLLFAEILVTRNLSTGLRNQTLNCLQIFASTCDVYLRKSNNFKTKIIPAFFQVMTEINQFSIEEWLEDLEDENLSKNDPCFVAIDSLKKIATSLGSKFLFPHFMPLITQNIQTNDWATIYTSLEAISALVNDSAEFFMNDLDQLMTIVLSGFRSTDVRVIYATFMALKDLSSEFAPTLQFKYHEQIVPCILNVMNSDAHIKLQVQAVKTLLHFCEGIIQKEEKTIMIPFGEQLLKSLIGLIRKALAVNSDILIQEVLNAISILSCVLDVYFARFYSDIMQKLKELLENISNTDEKRAQIRARAIDCIGFVIVSLRNEPQFIEEVDNMMEYFINVQRLINEEDIENSAILHLYSQLSYHLRHNFSKYMPRVFERVLKLSGTKIALITSDQENIQNQGDLGFNQIQPDVYDMDLPYLTIRLAAMDSIFLLSRNLGKEFYPYIKTTIPIIIKNFDHISRSLAMKALKTVKNLLMACENEADVVDILNYCIPAMLHPLEVTLKNVKDVRHSKFILGQINKSIRILTGPLLKEELVHNLIYWVNEALSLSQQEKATLVEKYKEMDDLDEEKKEEFKDDYEKVDDLTEVATDIIKTLFKLYGEKIENPVKNGLFNYYSQILTSPELSLSELGLAMQFFNTCLQFGSDQFFNQLVGDILKVYANCCKKGHSVNLKYAISGIGVITQRMDRTQFKNIKQEIFSLISDIIAAPDSFSPEKVDTTDAAIVVLGKIALYQYEIGNKMSELTLSKFLQLLPLKNNIEEAQMGHKMLLQEIQNKNEFLTSLNPKIQEQLLKTIQIIKKVDDSEPENEILDDFSRQIINQILQ